MNSPRKYVTVPKKLLSIIPNKLYFLKKTNISSNKVEKLGHKIIIHTGIVPIKIDELNSYTEKYTIKESNT
tara:strand:+ start:1312 stop:1524 length:213 start_codon:yes stop_codon:yes gene_type:complete